MRGVLNHFHGGARWMAIRFATLMKMKKSNIIVGVVVFSVLAFIVTSITSKTDSKTYTAISPDGTARLIIPSSALPEGVAVDAISITRIEDTDSAEGIVTYMLAPAGLTFKSPVRLEITLDRIRDTIPEIVHTSGETVETLEDVIIAMDQEAGTVTASGDISHFSEVRVIYPGFFSVAIVDPPSLEYFIDESFSVTVKVQNLTDTIYYNERKQSGEKKTRAWSLEGTLKGGNESIFNPSEVKDVPNLGPISGGAYDVTQTFTCVSDGTEMLNYEFWLSGRADVYYSFDEEPRYDIYHSKLVKMSTSAITCKPLLLDTSAGPGTGLQLTSHDPDGLNCPDAKYLSVDLGGFSKEVHKLRDGKCYPQEQFVPESGPDKCKQTHYHVELRSLGRSIRSDSQPCGAAVQPDIVASGTVWIATEQINDIIDFEFERR